jgi:uncharacterized membrane protein
MFGIPLHPLVVHFPIVLAVLLPISALVALWAIRRGTTARRGWAVPLAFAVTLSVSAFAATQTGDQEEERVERVVAEDAIHDHEEAGERFLVLSGILLLVVAAGLLPGTVGQAARLLSTAGAVGLVAAAVQVGHSGGSLVYRYGAASAYTADSAAVAQRATMSSERGGDDEH